MKKNSNMRELERSYYYSNATNALYAQWGKNFGLTYDSLFVLYAIYHNPEPCCQKDICEEWSMPKQTVHSILKSFEKKKYIRFVTNETDRRNKCIVLEAEGKRFAEDAIGRLSKIELLVIKRMGRKLMNQYLHTYEVYFQYFKEEMEKESGNGNDSERVF